MNLDRFGLKSLSVSDKPFIDSILMSVETSQAIYSFTANYIWRDLFQFYWGVLDNHFCMFATYSDYIYMPIPPVATEEKQHTANLIVKNSSGSTLDIITRVFYLMNSINKNRSVSRIENIDESQKTIFLSMGYDVTPGESEYVYLREDLINLKGNPFKSKRALCNYFVKNYQYAYEPFQQSYAEACIRLHDEWKMKRNEKFNDPLYRALLEDSSFSHRQAINHFAELSLTGFVVLINKRVEGYIFGYGKKDIFFIIMEITNPDIKGLSQFIFREFCRGLDRGYGLINTLGDSGLSNLRNLKLSYRPHKITLNYSAYEKALHPNPN